MPPLHLLDLPNEVIRDVVSLLPVKDVKAVRYCCRRLSDAASAFLYRSLYVSCHDPNLMVFEMVSDNPLLLGGVQELIIDDTTVSPVLLNRRLYQQLSSQDGFWKDRKTPYFPRDEDDSWDNEGRTWSPAATDQMHQLLVWAYENHHQNRLANSDVAALWAALPGMTSLRSLVLTNRTADDCPAEGAQSKHNSSPVVREWRKMGEALRERLPFPPRVDWWVPLEDDQHEGDEVFEPDWLLDGASHYMTPNEDDQFSHHEQDDDGLARSDDGNDDAQELALVHTQAENQAALPSNQTPLPLSTRLLRRESRGLRIAIEVLRNPTMMHRLTQFRVDASLDTLADVQTPGLSMRIFDFVAPPFVNQLSTAFSKMFLTSFAVVLSNGRENEAGQAILDQRQFSSVLASMHCLRHLMLEAHGMAVVGAIPERFTFPELRTAEFACGLIARPELRRFLRRHRNTLQHLRLLYCSVDDDEPSWSDLVQDILRLKTMGHTNLRTAVMISGYETVPFTGCGRNRSKTSPPPEEPVYSWTMGVNEDVVECPIEQLGHKALPRLPEP
ncbi:hypothetical protein CEP54_002538 [Fusarium duplospermum]|uniref:F-box domain-containing protein n=1 Tax=Fusarium duplospermum TaxID=1325734 RepID=A0A428QUW7_9HYPO|nr:hypothetical protein CEP54_002538 [Fusarium duplospermum]